jgi:hypothetical protein
MVEELKRGQTVTLRAKVLEVDGETVKCELLGHEGHCYSFPKKAVEKYPMPLPSVTYDPGAMSPP